MLGFGVKELQDVVRAATGAVAASASPARLAGLLTGSLGEGKGKGKAVRAGESVGPVVGSLSVLSASRKRVAAWWTRPRVDKAAGKALPNRDLDCMSVEGRRVP